MSSACPSPDNPSGLCQRLEAATGQTSPTLSPAAAMIRAHADQIKKPKPKPTGKIRCPDCGGVGGRFEGAEDCCYEGCCNVTCPTCGGSGEIWK